MRSLCRLQAFPEFSFGANRTRNSSIRPGGLQPLLINATNLRPAMARTPSLRPVTPSQRIVILSEALLGARDRPSSLGWLSGAEEPAFRDDSSSTKPVFLSGVWRGIAPNAVEGAAVAFAFAFVFAFAFAFAFA